MVRIARCGRIEKGERGRDRLADQKAARAADHRHERGVAGRPVSGIDRRAVGCRQVGGVEQILDADRQPAQRRGDQLSGGVLRAFARRLDVEHGEGADGALAGGDRLRTAIDDVGRRELAAVDLPGEVERAQRVRRDSRQLGLLSTGRAESAAGTPGASHAQMRARPRALIFSARKSD